MSKVARLMIGLMLLSVSITAGIAPQAFAKTKAEKQIKKESQVYATKRGKKYHKKNCRFIKNRDVIAMSVSEAESKGLKPCGNCCNIEK